MNLRSVHWPAIAPALVGATVLALGLSACADLSAALNAEPKSQTLSVAQAECDNGLGAEENTRLSLIQKLLDDGKPYAALANLDGSPEYPRVRYLRAEGLRKTGQTAAATAEYTALLGGCYDGLGQHGLGLIEAEHGKLAEALPHLKAARVSRPTDPLIRNDYGYALMLNHDYAAARIEFKTALELDSGNKLASANLARLDELAQAPVATPAAIPPAPAAPTNAMALLPAESLAIAPAAVPPSPATSSSGTSP
jgi:Flp pilus assembly protein TadD